MRPLTNVLHSTPGVRSAHTPGITRAPCLSFFVRRDSIYGARRASMPKVRQQGSSARGRIATARKSLGDFFRRLASCCAVERKPQGRGAVSAVRHSVSTPDTSLQDGVDSLPFASCACSAGIVGGVVRKRRRPRVNTVPSNFVQAAPVFAILLVLSQVLGAPDDNRC